MIHNRSPYFQWMETEAEGIATEYGDPSNRAIIKSFAYISLGMMGLSRLMLRDKIDESIFVTSATLAGLGENATFAAQAVEDVLHNEPLKNRVLALAAA